MSERLKPGLPLFAREGKPRDKGITIVPDRLDWPLEKRFLDLSSEYIDYVKIGQSLPLIIDRSILVDRIRHYHDQGLRVISGGTLIQVALKKGFIHQVLERLQSMGFDTVGIGESAIDIPLESKKEIVDLISSLSMECIFEIGKKEGPRLSTADLLSKIDEALKLNSQKVLLKAGRSGKWIGFYDQNGQISWDVLNEIVGRFGPPNLIFEAPEASQRVSLILEFGPSVNLASVPREEVLALEMHRLGLTTETLGLSPSIHTVEGSPASKFVYHLIKSEHPIDQAALLQRSGLPKRTLQASLSYLMNRGLVREVADMNDLRKHKYTPK